ncbi:FecCD family ABC transporter permease [Pseudolysinimonas sp.]|uniref:FecCD family ABC transporter permease n=1 Tax=Pseudolysinimonas sp. TaxID=2680009 RepID=UPI003F7EABAB
MTTTTSAPAAATTAPDTRLRRPAAVRAGWLLAAAGVLALALAASLALGNRLVPVDEILGALGGHDATIGEAAVRARIPRTVLGALVGAALGIAGATMQGVTRNPLADPGILGVSNGAAVAVVAGIVFLGISNPYAYIALALGGAIAAAVIVFVIGSSGRGGATPLKLALAGAATSAAFSSLIGALLLPRTDAMQVFRFWQVGGVGGADWTRIGVVAPFLLLGAVVCLVAARGLDLLALGDDLAAGLGARVLRTRLVAAGGAVLLAAAATAIAGPIGFVGLVVPHLCRLLVGGDHRWLVPFSAVAGAILLVAADVVGRVVVPSQEIEVGIVTAVIGAPVFIAIVRRRKVREL